MPLCPFPICCCELHCNPSLYQLPVMACGAVATYLLVRLIHGVATFRSYPEALDELKRVSLLVQGTPGNVEKGFKLYGLEGHLAHQS